MYPNILNDTDLSGLLQWPRLEPIRLRLYRPVYCIHCPSISWSDVTQNLLLWEVCPPLSSFSPPPLSTPLQWSLQVPFCFGRHSMDFFFRFRVKGIVSNVVTKNHLSSLRGKHLSYFIVSHCRVVATALI